MMKTNHSQPIQSTFTLSLEQPLAVLSVTESVKELLGFLADDFLTGKVTLQSLIHPHDQDIADVLFSVEMKQAALHFNIRLRQSNGRIRCVKGRYTKQKRSDSGDIILEVLLQDAKSLWHHHNDQTMMDNFKAMMENTDDYIYFKDRNHVFTGASQALTTVADSVKHWTEFLGVTDYDVFLEEYADIYYSLEKQVFSGVHIAHEVQETLLQDGSKGWVDNRKYPITNESGEIVGLFGVARDITESKLAEQALRDSEASLRESQEIAGLGNYVLDIKSGIWQSSEILDEILGIDETYARTEAGWDALIHPKDLPKAKLYLRRKFAAKSIAYDREYRIIRHSDKSERYIRGIGRLVLDDQGHISQMHGTIQDVTETRNELIAEKRAILGNKLIGVITVINHKIVWANAAFETMLGYNEGELIDMSVRQFFATEAQYQAVRNIYTSVEDGVALHSHQEFICKNGQQIWVDLSAAQLQQGSKESLWAVVDVTERKQTEIDLRIAATAFESQEGMLVTDANLILLRVNKAFTAITSYSSNEIIGKTPQFLSSRRQDDAFFLEVQKNVAQKGLWAGEIWCQRKNSDEFPAYFTITSVKNEDGFVINHVVTITDISERKQAAEKIEHLAFYDSLTHLPNRRLLIERLHHALAATARNSRDGALLFLDLDHFKTINDTLGHDVGDLLLQQVADRLTSSVREGDTVARLGGDEFVVMLEDLSESALEAAAQAKAVGEKVLQKLNEPFLLASNEYQSSVSIGVALFSEHGQLHEELLKHADIAMYQAKRAGRNVMQFFDPQMQHAIHARVDLERQLRKALEQSQLHLYYQIQVDDLNNLIGAEALIRWIHPERGMVSPFHFIPLAEETGLILPIGQWVIDTACAQLKAWEQMHKTRHLSLSINVSARQFHQPDFVAQITSAIQRHNINPMLLKLELTESMLVNNIEETITTMMAIRKLGVQFSLDDFGTGYSSLQYLKRLPLNQLKIDQSFVREIALDMSDQAIVRTIIAMAHTLNLNVIAEGVETKEQQDLLHTSGCTHFQGYLFGKPVPIEQLM